MLIIRIAGAIVKEKDKTSGIKGYGSNGTAIGKIGSLDASLIFSGYSSWSYS
ncbi:MAG: hypothetical protein IIB56_19085 [Planctomycetes bacterium]|nr:hypothetical protein [Planctomycetota bacterium]